MPKGGADSLLTNILHKEEVSKQEGEHFYEETK